MSSFTKLIALNLLACSFLVLDHTNASCARCEAIERQRAEEQASKGTQTQGYYDQNHKEKITAQDQVK